MRLSLLNYAIFAGYAALGAMRYFSNLCLWNMHERSRCNHP